MCFYFYVMPLMREKAPSTVSVRDKNVAVCLLGGLPAAKCAGAAARGAEAPGASASGGSRRVTGLHQVTTSRNRHSGHQGVPPLSWAEVCAADEAAARHMHALARRLGYAYERGAVPCELGTWLGTESEIVQHRL